MKKKFIWLLISAFLILLGAGFYIARTVFLPAKVQTKQYESKTQNAGVVQVEVTPENLIPGQDMKFKLSLNNHQISLDYDFVNIATIIDDEGKIYKPISWTGGSGGHHVNGGLIFGKLDKNAKHIGLNITGIDNQKVLFDWEL